MLTKLQQVFRDVFKDNNLIITKQTSAKNINMWDSLTHLELIAAIEDAFKINFSFDEVMQFNSVGDLLKVLEEKTNRP
jgi:acyl carrier protein